MPVILNIDFDVFYDSDQDTTRAPTKALVVRPASILPSLRIVQDAIPFLCLDHHEVLAEWDRRGLRNAVCVHLDAHHDLHTDFNRAWEIPLASRGRHIGAGDYLFHALREGMIESLVWVAPSWISRSHAEQDLRKRLGSALSRRVSIEALSSFHWDFHPASVVTIALSPEWTPQQDVSVAGDFATRMNGLPSDVERWMASAESRYTALSDPTVHPLDLRFKFSHATVDRRTRS